jgi:hypothetical protein
MSKFVTKPIEAISGKQEFKQLVILPDDADISKTDIDKTTGQWDKYENGLEKKYQSSFNRIVSIMDGVANLQGFSDTQFKDVTPAGELVKEYEFKSGDLRAFAIKIPNGKLVVLGGYKNQQTADFKKFRSLKKQYLDSIKQ